MRRTREKKGEAMLRLVPRNRITETVRTVFEEFPPGPGRCYYIHEPLSRVCELWLTSFERRFPDVKIERGLCQLPWGTGLERFVSVALGPFRSPQELVASAVFLVLDDKLI
jgi:hypothetical protein